MCHLHRTAAGHHSVTFTQALLSWPNANEVPANYQSAFEKTMNMAKGRLTIDAAESPRHGSHQGNAAVIGPLSLDVLAAFTNSVRVEVAVSAAAPPMVVRVGCDAAGEGVCPAAKSAGCSPCAPPVSCVSCGV